MDCKWKYFKAEMVGGLVETVGDKSCLLGETQDISGYPKAGGVWAKWDFNDGQLTIENDCLGFCPLYYFVDEKKIIVSNSIIKIISLAGDVELDEDSLRMLFWKRYFLQNKTAYKNIYSLAPNTTIKWSNGKFEISSSLLPVKPRNLTQEQIVDGYIDLFKQAMSRNLPDEDFIMPLSGGRDSRWMLLELLDRGYKPKVCVSCGEVRDIELAKELIDRLGLEHNILVPNHRWVKDGIRKNAKISFSTFQHNWLMGLCDFVRNSGYLSYDGNGVGMFSRNAYVDNGIKQFELFRADKFDELENDIFSQDCGNYRCIEKMPDEFDFFRKDTADLKQAHYGELKRYKCYVNDLSAYSFYSNTRTAISTCPFGLMYPAKIKFPYLDYDLFNFLASIEPEQFIASEPQAIAVRKAFPKMADIKFYDEIKFKPSPKASRFVKSVNVLELSGYLAKFNLPSLKSLAWVKFVDKLDKSDYGQFTNMLLSLSMIKYCSKQKNASAVLDMVEKMDSAV